MANRIVFALLLVASVCAHMSLWHPSVYDKEPNNKDSNLNSNPLQDQNFVDWWWHGNLNYPPQTKAVFEIKANSKVEAWLSTNRAFTPYGYPDRVDANPRTTPNPWAGSFFSKVNNAHAGKIEDVGGCALGIAYKSDRFAVRPEDFVIFSVARDCPSRFLQSFDVPNLPACPNGVCQCAWFWIHKSIVGGSDQNYMTPFVCNVTGSTSTAQPIDYSNARPPRKCLNPANCVQGPRHPMYWKNNERNNMPEGPTYAPTYSHLYGWSQGAQKDIFVNTNPNDYSVKSFPAEQKCQDRSINPNGYGSRLTSSNTMSSNQGSYFISANCKWKVWIQGDGNLLVGSTTSGELSWTCGCNGRVSGDYFSLVLENNGQLSVKGNRGDVAWTAPMTKDFGKGPYRVEITNEGVLAMFDGTGKDIWETNWSDYREEASYTPFTPEPSYWNKIRNNTASTSQPTPTEKYYGTIEDGDRWGSDLPNMPTSASTVKGCQLLCAQRSDCQSWSYDSCGQSQCWLKTDKPSVRSDGCRKSGLITNR